MALEIVMYGARLHLLLWVYETYIIRDNFVNVTVWVNFFIAQPPPHALSMAPFTLPQVVLFFVALPVLVQFDFHVVGIVL